MAKQKKRKSAQPNSKSNSPNIQKKKIKKNIKDEKSPLQRAARVGRTFCTSTEISISPTMFPFMFPHNYRQDKKTKAVSIQPFMPNVNHNAITQKNVVQIVNQIYGNPANIMNEHLATTYGKDMHAFAIFWDRVRVHFFQY